MQVQRSRQRRTSGVDATGTHAVKEWVLWTAQLCGLFALARWLTRRRLRVLCYHGIWLGPPPHFGDCLFMSAERFQARLALLERRGYRVLPLGQACAQLDDLAGDGRNVVLTIDDAWAGTGVHMLPALKARGLPATLYVTTENAMSGQPVWHVLVDYILERAQKPLDIGALLPAGNPGGLSRRQLVVALVSRLLERPAGSAREAELRRIGVLAGVDADAVLASRAFNLMTPVELRQASQDGFDLQLHTHTHRMPDFDLNRIRGEVEANRDALATITLDRPDRFTHFCYPGGVYHPSLFPLLEELGIKSATTTDAGLVAAGDNMLAMRRILDCESMSDLEFEARLTGLWMVLDGARTLARRVMRAAPRPTISTQA